MIAKAAMEAAQKLIIFANEDSWVLVTCTGKITKGRFMPLRYMPLFCLVTISVDDETNADVQSREYADGNVQ